VAAFSSTRIYTFASNKVIPLNLKTASGRCAPLALGQNAAIPEFTIPADVHSALAFTRPPITDRACCSGDDGDAQAAPYFTPTEGEGPQPVVPDPSWLVSTLNLRSNTGRCAPLAMAQPTVPEFSVSDLDVASIAWTRPPLTDRACCSGDDGDSLPQPYFTVSEGCRYIALEDGFGFFALEDESGYLALECAL
jgi:hypothetical protein